jgi:hypothetical protein
LDLEELFPRSELPKLLVCNLPCFHFPRFDRM